MVFRETVVTSGSGRAVVVATGRHTEFGRIQALVDTAAAPDTPMQRQLARLDRLLGLLVDVLAVDPVAGLAVQAVEGYPLGGCGGVLERHRKGQQIGRASCRERVCQYG